MKDVADAILPLQDWKLFRHEASGDIVVDPNVVLPGTTLWKSGWRILDASAVDGITLKETPFTDAGIDSDARKATAAGRVFAIDAESGTTRLCFVWVPTYLVRALQEGTLREPPNFHVLFHPPTYETYYKKTRPYWTGLQPKVEDGGDPRFAGKAMYVWLGQRYLCSDFFAVAHHVMAVTARDPALIYVVPVADHPANFGDLIDPDGMLRILLSLYHFIARKLAPAHAPRFERVGRIMLSAYSRSGDRLTTLMRAAGSGHPLFAQHLAQLNNFDINLGNNDEERLPVFTQYWKDVCAWKGRVNPQARAFVYTAYPSHFAVCEASPPPVVGGWQTVSRMNLDDVAWSEPAKKALRPATSRGAGTETYTSDGAFGAVCLPVSFFEHYLTNDVKVGNKIEQVIVGNKLRGWANGTYGIGRSHSHGLFLRGMLSHAIAHAAPAFFGPIASRQRATP